MGNDKFDADDVRELYDMNPDWTIAQVAGVTGIPYSEVKKILLEGYED